MHKCTTCHETQCEETGLGAQHNGIHVFLHHMPLHKYDPMSPEALYNGPRPVVHAKPCVSHLVVHAWRILKDFFPICILQALKDSFGE